MNDNKVSVYCNSISSDTLLVHVIVTCAQQGSYYARILDIKLPDGGIVRNCGFLDVEVAYIVRILKRHENALRNLALDDGCYVLNAPKALVRDPLKALT